MSAQGSISAGTQGTHESASGKPTTSDLSEASNVRQRGASEPRRPLTASQLELCRRVGLVREVSPGVFEITRAGRALLGEKPPAPRLEPLKPWLARVDALRSAGGRS